MKFFMATLFPILFFARGNWVGNGAKLISVVLIARLGFTGCTKSKFSGNPKQSVTKDSLPTDIENGEVKPLPGVVKPLPIPNREHIYFDLTIATEGDYSFRLNSDDGSILKVDGKIIIDNDGLHDVSSKEASIYLTPGPHQFNVAYFQGPRVNIALELFWKSSGAESYLPLDIVSRPARIGLR